MRICSAIQSQSILSNVDSSEWCHQPHVALAVACNSSGVKPPSAQKVGMPAPKKEESPVFGALCHSAMRLRSERLSTAWWKLRSSAVECADHRVVPSIPG